MTKLSNYSHFEDLRRIKSGYMPKIHFIYLYNLIKIFMVLKLFAYRKCNNFVAEVFDDGDSQKKYHVLPFGFYNR